MMIGMSMELRDKRVDKIAQNLHLDHPEIYFSPFQSWLTSLTLFFTYIQLPAFILIYQFDILKFFFWFFIIAYFIVGYIVNSYMSHSILMDSNSLYIINPNFIFMSIVHYPLCEITHIKLGETKHIWHHIFGVLGSNFIEIESHSIKRKFFCVWLEIDAYDENWTEKTMDDLYYNLQKKNIDVEVTIKDF